MILIWKREAERLQVINEKNPRVDHDMHGSKDMADCVANCIWYVTTQSPVNMRSRICLCEGVLNGKEE